MINEAHTGERRGSMALRVLIARMRHDGCGGGAGRVELLTGIDGVSGPPCAADRAAGRVMRAAVGSKLC
jgi:hypothetical protein